MVAKGASEQEISAYVAAYHKNKLVNLVLEQTLVPVWVLNQDIQQKAINTLARIMVDTKVSPKVQVEAASALLSNLKRPEKLVVELPMSPAAQSGMNELSRMLATLARQQQELIAAGISTREIAHQKLVPVAREMRDITPDAPLDGIASKASPSAG